MKLHQVIALVLSKKNRAKTVLTEAYKLIQRQDVFFGMSRTYVPKDEDSSKPTGEQLPPEFKPVQGRVSELLSKNGHLRSSLIEMLDIIATQDVGNQKACSDVVVDGAAILSDIPAVTLIFLEKQLVDLMTFIEKLPVLDSSENWVHDEDANLFKTTPTTSVRTKKVPRAFVKYEATKEHPAQVEVVNDDMIVGSWNTHKLSGATTVRNRDEWLERARLLKEAVVLARESANSIEVQEAKIGQKIFGYIFGDTTQLKT